MPAAMRQIEEEPMNEYKMQLSFRAPRSSGPQLEAFVRNALEAYIKSGSVVGQGVVPASISIEDIQWRPSWKTLTIEPSDD